MDHNGENSKSVKDLIPDFNQASALLLVVLCMIFFGLAYFFGNPNRGLSHDLIIGGISAAFGSAVTLLVGAHKDEQQKNTTNQLVNALKDSQPATQPQTQSNVQPS